MLTVANFKFTLGDGFLYGYFSSTGLQHLELHNNHVAPPFLLHSTPNRSWGHTLHALLENYAATMPVSFKEVPLDLSAGTPFQQTVWHAATTIPYGDAWTYGRLAQRINQPNAARAVGMALGANPACIVVPCHRVLAANGKLGGFSAGLHWKRFLLDLEGVPFSE